MKNTKYYQRYSYCNGRLKDVRGNFVYIGDEVAFNNHYGATLFIGTVTHFVSNTRVGIKYLYTCAERTEEAKAYREVSDIVVIKHTEDVTHQDQEQGFFEAL